MPSRASAQPWGAFLVLPLSKFIGLVVTLMQSASLESPIKLQRWPLAGCTSADLMNTLGAVPSPPPAKKYKRGETGLLETQSERTAPVPVSPYPWSVCQAQDW